MYVAMNKFSTVDGKADEFEKVWKTRDSYLDEVPGFKTFQLLRGKEGSFVAYTTWESHQSFVDWTQSEAFKKAHSQGKSKGLLQGHPEFSGYDVVM